MGDRNPTYYAIIPAIVRYDSDLKPNEKLMYGEITSLSNKNGECTASNEYFAKLYNVHKKTISNWINHLKGKKYINLEFFRKKGKKEIEYRVIKISISPIHEIMDTYPQNNGEGIHEITEDNNTSNNSSNNKEEIYKEESIFEIIEGEFGRTLSPLEYEMIGTWDYPVEILKVAVSEASTSGNLAIKYIDKIIFNWKKKGLKSVVDVKRSIADFKNRKEKRENNNLPTEAEEGASYYRILR